MADRQHIIRLGASARWRALHTHEVNPVTVEAAVEQRATMTLADRRAFIRGWRIGASTEAMDRLRSCLPYLDKDELDALGTELQTLAEKYFPLSLLMTGRKEFR